MLTLRNNHKRFQVLNIVEGTGRQYQGLSVAVGTKSRKPRERFLWFPKAQPKALIDKAALLLRFALDKGFQPSADADEPMLVQLDSTPVHPYLKQALAEARKRAGKPQIQACKMGVATICPTCDEVIPQRQQAMLCTEKSDKGLVAYLLCSNCYRELD